MTYKDELTRSMTFLGQDPQTLYIGYNVACGSQANGTLSGVPKAQLIETPVAENLMVGVAIGLALQGFKPVVYFERYDFILNALDAIVNHLDKTGELSDYQFYPHIIIRVLVGATDSPLFSGPTHTQDFTRAMLRLVRFPIMELHCAENVYDTYIKAYNQLGTCSTLIVEYRDKYSEALTAI